MNNTKFIKLFYYMIILLLLYSEDGLNCIILTSNSFILSWNSILDCSMSNFIFFCNVSFLSHSIASSSLLTEISASWVSFSTFYFFSSCSLSKVSRFFQTTCHVLLIESIASANKSCEGNFHFLTHELLFFRLSSLIFFSFSSKSLKSLIFLEKPSIKNPELWFSHVPNIDAGWNPLIIAETILKL